MHVRVDPGALPGLAVFKDIDAPWWPEMVVLPAGEFMMGAPDTDEGEVYAKPQRRVEINYRLAVGRYPVMFDKYDHFCAAAGRWKPEDRGWGRGRRGVRGSEEGADGGTKPAQETWSGHEGLEETMPTFLQGIATKAAHDKSYRFRHLFGMLTVA